jgi:hypothetical protein
MKLKLTRVAPVLLALLLVPSLHHAADFGWGPRVGFSSDPDQIFGGVHLALGEFARGVRFQPSAEIGFGDDVTTVAVNAMVSYYFPVEAPVTPYVGGQLTVAFYDFDSDCKGFGNKFGNKNECDSETEIGPAAVGGIEMDLEGGSRFLSELSIGFSDLPEVKLTAGWTF